MNTYRLNLYSTEHQLPDATYFLQVSWSSLSVTGSWEQLPKAPPMPTAPDPTQPGSGSMFSVTMNFVHGEQLTAGPTLSLTGNSPVGTVSNIPGTQNGSSYDFPPTQPTTPGYYAFNAIVTVSVSGETKPRIYKVDPKMIVEPG